MKAKHTPGPWTRGGIDGALIWGANGIGVAIIPYIPVPPADYDSEANARLIAAAPDLLAALEALLPVAESVDCGGLNAFDIADRLEAARAAIARAAGEA